MPLTLAQAKVGMANHVDQTVIDEFRRSSLLMDKLTFDNSVSPGTGGSTLVYGYLRLKTPSTAAFREINAEYTASEAVKEAKSVALKIFGGKFSIDRVLAQTSGKINEVEFQLNQLIKATTNMFHNAVINGDSSVAGFDGLDVMLAGTSTEFNTSAQNAIDISTSANLDSNYKKVLDMLDELLASVDGTPTMIMGNTKMITKLQACARRAGYLTQSEDAFGKKVSAYNSIPLVDLGYYYSGSATKAVVPITKRSYGATGSQTEVTGLTDLYAVRLGLDAFHGVSLTGNNIISTHMPDFTTEGAVKSGDVEMVAATALKNSRAAAVLRNFKVE